MRLLIMNVCLLEMATSTRVLTYSLGRLSTRIQFSYSNTRLTFLSLEIFPFIFLFEIFPKNRYVKMPPQKSAVWNYFKRSLNGNTDKCTLCDAQLTFCGGRTNLINQVEFHTAHAIASG